MITVSDDSVPGSFSKFCYENVLHYIHVLEDTMYTLSFILMMPMFCFLPCFVNAENCFVNK